MFVYVVQDMVTGFLIEAFYDVEDALVYCEADSDFEIIHVSIS